MEYFVKWAAWGKGEVLLGGARDMETVYHQGSDMSENDCWMVKQFSQESVYIRDLAPAWIEVIIRDDKAGSKNKNKTNFDLLRKWMIMKPLQELSLDFSSGSISLVSSMSHMEEGREVLKKS